MYPIFSLLRRCAASMSYTSSENIKIQSLSLILLNTSEGFTLTKNKKINLYELQASGSPQSCAIELSKFETELFKSLKLSNKVYSLFVGPAEYNDNTLKIRIGLALGLHRK